MFMVIALTLTIHWYFVVALPALALQKVVTTGLADVSLPFFLDAEMERQSVLWLLAFGR